MSEVSTAQNLASYSSKRMQERRRIILATTRRLVAEYGLGGFTMRQIAEQSGVSVATLFNIYANRETLVSHAVLDAFDSGRDGGVTDTPENYSELQAYVAWTAREVIALGNYVDAIVATYFSRPSPNRLREILIQETEAPYIHYLTQLARQGKLRETVDIASAARMIANHIFAGMHAWSIDELSDAALEPELQQGVDCILRGLMTVAPPHGA